MSIVTGLLNVIYSAFCNPACFLCQRRMNSAGICSSCFSDKGALLVPTQNRCLGCYKPDRPKDSLCGDCSRKRPAIRHIRALFTYNHQIKRLIRAMKFDGRHPIANLLAVKMAQELSQAFTTRDWGVIVPIPISAIRLRNRGYNQAEILARIIADHVKLPTLNAIKVDGRSMAESSQSLRSYRARLRLRNENPFSLRYQSTGALVREKSILLIDDVITTGATALAATQALLAAGARSVDLYTIAISQSWDGWARTKYQ